MIYFILLLVVLSRGDLVPSDRPECQRDQFDSLPPNITYVPLGGDVNITCTHTTIPRNNLQVRRLPSTDVIQCTSNPMCTLDVDSGIFTLHNFQSNYNGTYQFDFFVEGFHRCYVNFDVIEAVAPTLEKEPGPFTYNEGDEMILQPTVTHGLPPDTLQWFKDGVMIHEGNTFRVTGVTASNRGHYTANISNIAGNVIIEYEVLIQFPALITLSTTPNLTDPTLINGPIMIHCSAIAYPNISEISLWKVVRGNVISVSGVTTTINNALLSTLNYEASAELTIQDCSPQLYRCRVRNGNYQRESNIGICQSAPNITGFQIDKAASTNTSVSLKWAFTFADAIVTQYEFSSRRANTGENWKLMRILTDVNAINLSYNFENLSPGVMYDFQMRAMNDKGYGMYTNIETFTTFAEPQDVPKGITVKRSRTQNIDDIHLHWQSPPVLEHAPVTAYQVKYSINSADSTPYTEETDIPYFNLTGVDSSSTYFFRVQAKNKWGSSNYSALVESPANRDDPNANLVTVQTTVELSNTKVVVGWTLTGREYVKSLTIQISLVEIHGPDNVVFHDVYKFNVTLLTSTEQCFSDLNASDTYQFCVIALLNSGSSKSDCQLGTTTSTDIGVGDRSSCQSVVGAVINKKVIPGWAIGVIVVGAVLLVFFVFGGCGLYYGIKHTKKGGGDFDSPHQSLDPIPHNGMNGYPYSQQRAPSPGRSCMSYRHHQHQHGMEWPMKEAGITAV